MSTLITLYNSPIDLLGSKLILPFQRFNKLFKTSEQELAYTLVVKVTQIVLGLFAYPILGQFVLLGMGMNVYFIRRHNNRLQKEIKTAISHIREATKNKNDDKKADRDALEKLSSPLNKIIQFPSYKISWEVGPGLENTVLSEVCEKIQELTRKEKLCYFSLDENETHSDEKKGDYVLTLLHF